jgi:hypothetical protein
MLRKIFASGLAMSSLTWASAQDSTKTNPLTISGSADVYYKYDFAKTKANNLTSFTNSHNSFELGMASLKLDYKTAKTEVVADVGFGKRAQEFSYNDEGVLAAVKQLYISYSPISWLKFTAGSWATHVGYELVDAYANRNYSMSYMFTNGPFFHTGLKAEASYKNSGFMIGIVNPTDFKYVPDGLINKKFFIAQYSFTPSDHFKGWLNYVSGQNVDTTKSQQVDLVVSSKISNKFSLAYNGTFNHTKRYLGNKVYDDYKNWWGSAVYLNFDATTHFGLTLREEYFSDKDGLKTFATQINGGHIMASTLSANIRIDNLVLIPEFRYDHSNRDLFYKQDGSPTHSAGNVLLAAVYSF